MTRTTKVRLNGQRRARRLQPSFGASLPVTFFPRKLGMLRRVGESELEDFGWRKNMNTTKASTQCVVFPFMITVVILDQIENDRKDMNGQSQNTSKCCKLFFLLIFLSGWLQILCANAKSTVFDTLFAYIHGQINMYVHVHFYTTVHTYIHLHADVQHIKGNMLVYTILYNILMHVFALMFVSEFLCVLDSMQLCKTCIYAPFVYICLYCLSWNYTYIRIYLYIPLYSNVLLYIYAHLFDTDIYTNEDKSM